MKDKKSYFNAMEVLKKTREFDQKLCDLGFSFEYNDDSIVGDYFSTVLTNMEGIIVSSLGLTMKVAETFCKELNTLVNIDIYYPDDNDARFAISADDLFEIIYNVNRSDVTNLLWLAIAEKDLESKEKLERMAKVKFGDRWSK